MARVHQTRTPRSPAGRRLLRRALTVEAMALLAVGSALQKWVPMPKWSFVLGHAGAVPEPWSNARQPALPQRAATPIERRVARAVRAGGKRLSWQPTCLAEAIAGQALLRQFGEPGVVVIGLRPTDEGPWDAHAWLLGRSGALTGGPAAKGFTATTVFEVPAGLDAEQIALT